MPKTILFWKANEVPYGVFFQWSPHGFTKDGVYYSCTERWMMSEKARMFEDKAMRTKGIWQEHAFNIVVVGNLEKFTQNKRLGDILVSTNSAIIAEASPYDRIWGIGLSATDPKSRDPQKWRGENLLGKALMEVREVLYK